MPKKSVKTIKEKSKAKASKSVKGKKASSSKKNKEFEIYQISDISQAEKLASQLFDYVKNSNEKVILNATSVARITTPCIQVIISFFVLCKEAGIVFNISSPSDAFIEAFEDLGLNKFLNEITN